MSIVRKKKMKISITRTSDLSLEEVITVDSEHWHDVCTAIEEKAENEYWIVLAVCPDHLEVEIYDDYRE